MSLILVSFRGDKKNYYQEIELVNFNMISRTLKLFAAPLRLPFARSTVPIYTCAFLKEKQEQDKL